MLGGDFVGEKELSVSHSLFYLLLPVVSTVYLSFCPVVSFASRVEAKSSGLAPLPSSYTSDVHTFVLNLLLVMRVKRKRLLPFHTAAATHTGDIRELTRGCISQKLGSHKCVPATVIFQASLPLEEQALISRFWFRAESLLVRIRVVLKPGCSNLRTKFISKRSIASRTILALGCWFPP